MLQATEELTIKAAASKSSCGNYRYWLSRIWDADTPIGMFVCMNPSKATAHYSDQTMGNCQNLAVHWGWGGFYIVNLYAYMVTDPKQLKGHKGVDAINDQAILDVAAEVHHIVLAWGNGNIARGRQVKKMLAKYPLNCIEKNLGGGYLHPSRVTYLDHPNPLIV